MSDDRERFAKAATSLLGTPFRLHGRSPEHGLDCVGLISASLVEIGRTVTLPTQYRLRNSNIGAMLACVGSAGFGPFEGTTQTGDVLLATPGPGQHHLLVVAPQLTGHIHAHAGLRKVVLTPGACPWPIVKQWRLQDPRKD